METGSQARENAARTANRVELSPGSHISNDDVNVIALYAERFKRKDSVLSHAQGLATSVTENAYNMEQSTFSEDCTQIFKSDVPYEANIIASHVLYKIKTLDDGTLMCKYRIAPQGNKEKDKNKLKRDSNAYASNGM